MAEALVPGDSGAQVLQVSAPRMQVRGLAYRFFDRLAEIMFEDHLGIARAWKLRHAMAFLHPQRVPILPHWHKDFQEWQNKKEPSLVA